MDVTPADPVRLRHRKPATAPPVLDWRNWRLPVKLAAVLVVPVLVALGAGVLQIQNYAGRAATYAHLQDLVAVRAGLIPLITSLQAERTMVARGVPEAGVYQEQGRTTQTAAQRLRELRAETDGLGDVSASRFFEAIRQLDPLPGLRAEPGDGPRSITAYTVAVKSLLDFDQALVSQFGDPLLSGTAIALHHTEVAREQVALQQAVLLIGISRGELLGAELRTLSESHLRLTDRLSDFQAVATSGQRRDLLARLDAVDVTVRERLVQTALNGDGAVRTDPSEWNRASEATIGVLTDAGGSLAADLRATAGRLQDETSDRAGLAAVVLLGMVVVAGAIGWVIGRQLLRSLGALRRSALEVADRRLPAVVADIRANADPDTAIDPVPVHTTDELGQLARAFDKVHRQAVVSATEQAELRSDMRNIFVNLSRRSQSLVERQLKLMEELERKEEDPDQLANLFKLDHLATRMRRNNENLMVLSGTEVSRRFGRPVPLVNVLRAAVSEIEQYQRVVVQPAPPIDVVGYAAGDVVHLVAELLDNATAFSPPGSQVVIGARTGTGGGLVVEIVDAGIGMESAELAAVNRRLAEDAPSELPVSRQLGLFVVARLARRQGLAVRLRRDGGDGRGLRAAVVVPAELVRAQAAPQRPTASAASPAVPKPGPTTAMSAPTLTTRPVPAPAAPRSPAARNSAPFSPAPDSPAPDSPAPDSPVPMAPSGAWFSGELPKRVARTPGFGSARTPAAARKRDPERVRGFLSNYQSGARRSAPEANERNERP
ncbi:nitrate- and nitrite sensing domain-containing protein [Actinokineospora guangxiensis]|uniref:histidine kinase n=1 Tax=Actinokineospora guangxiensis TaxID=1490288 RepID=A0ABW0EQP8_9PSEU